MTIEADQPPGEIRSEERLRAGGEWRWLYAGIVLVLLTYFLAYWMRGGGQETAVPSRQAAAQGALRASLEAYRSGKYQEAIAAAKRALAADPTSAAAYNNMAVAQLALGELDEAAWGAQEAIRLKPDFQLAKNNLAWIRREKAKVSGRPISGAASAEADGLVARSLEHFRAGRFSECIDAATQAARLNPASAAAFANIGICNGSLRRWDEAIRNTQEALRLDPALQIAKNNLAWMQRQKALAQSPR